MLAAAIQGTPLGSGRPAMSHACRQAFPRVLRAAAFQTGTLEVLQGACRAVATSVALTRGRPLDARCMRLR